MANALSHRFPPYQNYTCKCTKFTVPFQITFREKCALSMTMTCLSDSQDASCPTFSACVAYVPSFWQPFFRRSTFAVTIFLPKDDIERYITPSRASNGLVVITLGPVQSGWPNAHFIKAVVLLLFEPLLRTIPSLGQFLVALLLIFAVTKNLHCGFP